VQPGFGLYFSNQTNPWITPAGTSLANNVVPDNTTAGIVVLECPQGMYGTGGNAANVNAFCEACPAGFTTSGVGSTAASDCNCECVATVLQRDGFMLAWELLAVVLFATFTCAHEG
jgi:hypothetical protein